MARTRDYKTEYQHRIANAAKRGLTRSQARGHARAGEASVRPAKRADNKRLEAALKTYRQTGNQTTAAKSVGISSERLRRFLRENVEVQRRGRTLKITDNRIREMTVLSAGEAHRMKLHGFDEASLNGRHLAAVGDFLQSNNAELLAPFRGRFVTDAKGMHHILETDPNALYRLAAAGSEVFHNVYRLKS